VYGYGGLRVSLLSHVQRFRETSTGKKSKPDGFTSRPAKRYCSLTEYRGRKRRAALNAGSLAGALPRNATQGAPKCSKKPGDEPGFYFVRSAMTCKLTNLAPIGIHSADSWFCFLVERNCQYWQIGGLPARLHDCQSEP